MKFLCDDNLGKLARYLRLLGYDTFYEKTISDPALLAVMLKQNRMVLTRDSRLAQRIEPHRCFLLRTDLPEEQLQSVIEHFRLPVTGNTGATGGDETNEAPRIFSRCLICNEPCIEVDKASIADKVFPYLIKTHEHFRQCPVCGRIYWRGSHYHDMRNKLAAILKKIKQ